MKIRKLVALCMALCLITACVPALAAPTRDAQAMEVTVEERLQSLTELVVNAAILQGMPAELGGAPRFSGLAQGAAPSDSLAACVLAWGIWSGFLPFQGTTEGQETIRLNQEEAQALIGRVFTTGYSVPALAQPRTGAGTWYANGELNMQFASMVNYGAYIYSAEYDGSDVKVLCDVFSVKNSNFHQSAEDVAENELEWRYNAALSLRFAPETAFGYTVNAFSFSPAYQNGDLAKWKPFENTEYEYSLNLPVSLGVADAAPARRSWQSADGKVTLTVEAKAEAQSLEQAAARYLAAHPGVSLIRESEFSRFCDVEKGRVTMVVASEALSWTYTLTFTFPEERQAEYELYAEILRNSLSIWGVSNG